LRNNGIDLREVSTRFEPYLSLDPDFVVKRALAALGSPATVSASLDRDVLKLAGTAPRSWILHARNAGTSLSLLGINSVSTNGLVDSDLEALRAEVERPGILFAPDSSVVAPEQAPVAKALAAKARQWWNGAIAIEAIPRLEVVGYADTTGTKPGNLDLSRRRAEEVARFLIAEGISRESILITGAGEEAGADAAHQRRAVVRANLISAGSPARSAR
jgi:OOP family OmpA-OmpF porin